MTSPLILPWQGILPALAARPLHAGPASAVLGRVTAGAGLWLGARATIRADGHDVRLGADVHVGPGATVHIAHDRYPTHVGAGVSIGAGAVVHACTLGAGVHLGAGAIVLDGAEIAAGAALAPGAVVFPRKQLAGGWLYGGMPARPLRPLTPEALAALHAETRAAPDGAAPPPSDHAARTEGFAFVAATARISGPVTLGEEAGIWYGCALEGPAGITIGARANVQDNSRLIAADGPVIMGEEATIGHNVTVESARIGPRALVGIGAHLAPGTEVGADVLLAAGARTQPGQVLEAGSFYAGAPARRMGALDAGKRAIIAATWPMYVHYARNFARAEQERA
ncbi:MAG: gamma carbonic anhydrase family protein [Rhodobacteraceae bacterium]|nr:gamma carbonic anhydrase family protein [Paracoccaceae bacterium]